MTGNTGLHAETVAQRVAHNEHAFREANERIEATADEIESEIDLIPFICECPARDCMEIARLERDEYERVRADPRGFIVAPGHEVIQVEGVVVAQLIEKFERFSQMQKVGEAGAVAAELDNRSDA